MELEEVLYQPRFKLTELAEYDFLYKELTNHLTPIENYMLCKTSKQFNHACNKSINEIIEKGIKYVDCIEFFYTTEKQIKHIITTFIVINQKLNITFGTTSKYILPDMNVFSIAVDHSCLYILDTSGSLYSLFIDQMYHNQIVIDKIQVDNILSITPNYLGVFINALHGVYLYEHDEEIKKEYDDYVKYISAGYFHYTMISQNNHLLAFGFIGDEIDLSKITSFHNVIHIASGENHTIVVTKNKVYSFGQNTLGQLATGNRLEYNGAVNVTKNINPKSIISCGDFSTTVLYQGKLYSYGWDEVTKTSPNNPLTKFNIDGVIDVYCRDSLTLLLVEKDGKKYIYNYEAYILKQSFLGTLYSRYTHAWEIPENYNFTQL